MFCGELTVRLEVLSVIISEIEPNSCYRAPKRAGSCTLPFEGMVSPCRKSRAISSHEQLTYSRTRPNSSSRYPCERDNRRNKAERLSAV